MKDLYFDPSHFSSVLLDTIGALIVVLDENEKILAFNRACERISGFTFDEVRGKEFSLFLNELERQVVKSIFSQLLSGNSPIHYQNYWTTRSGEQRWIEWTNSAVQDEKGNTRYVLATGIDETERHRFEAQLLEMNRELERRVQERTAALQDQIEQSLGLQNKLNQILRASPVVILTLNPNPPFEITFASDNIEVLFGYRPEQVINRPQIWQEWIVTTPPPCTREFFTLLCKDSSINLEVEFRKADGRICWIQLVFSLVCDHDGKALEIHGSIQDITTRLRFESEIREREELYRSLAESAQDFIFMIDPAGTIQYVNTFGASSFRMKPEDLIGKPRRDFFPEEESAHQQHNIDQVFSSNEVAYHEDLISFPGRKLWLGTRLVPIHDRNGKVVSVLGVSRDITKRKVAEIELQQALQKEKELNELRANFVSMMTHQVGTPLSTILSSAEMLKHYGDHWPEERRQKHLERIIDATKRVDAMVRDMLELGRTDIGLVRKDNAQTNLVELCLGMVELFRLDDLNKHRIVFTPPPDPIICQLDGRLIQQALENLLSNAIKFSPAGTEIELKLSATGESVSIHIDDQGLGISAQDLQQIGTPFYRARNVSRIPGTGLGLTLVRRAIDALGGKMKISSQENSGTSVTIEIPCLVERSTGSSGNAHE